MAPPKIEHLDALEDFVSCYVLLGFEFRISKSTSFEVEKWMFETFRFNQILTRKIFTVV